MFLSILVGITDGIGLAMFIPLLQIATLSKEADQEGLITDIIVNVLGIPPTLLNILLLIFIFFSLKGILKFSEGYLRVVYQQMFMRKIRLATIDDLASFNYIHFSKADAGRIQNTLGGEVGRINTAFRFYFRSFQYGVLVLVYVLMAIAADALFAFLVAVGGLLINQLLKFLYTRTKFLSSKLTRENHKFQGLLIQMVSLFKYLKTTGLNTTYAKKLKDSAVGLEKTQKRIGIVDSLLNSIREPLIILIVIIAIYLQSVFFGRNIGLILFSLLLLYRALTFFMAMQESWNLFLGVSGSLDHMKSFNSELKAGKENIGKENYEGIKEKLSLKNVSFCYGDSSVLKNIKLEVRKNETLAFIGNSGAGKSTLLSIITGLLKPTSGEIFIDNQNLDNFDLNSYRKRIGYIAQDAPVFNDSVYNNVTFWAEKTTENQKKFLHAIDLAAFGNFIEELPERENTLLGNNGINLSGGQKQRLSIARELFKEVDLLILDEATSALDSGTEAIIQENLMKLKGNVTLLIIAHRLATVKFADRIVIMEAGEIQAINSFENLMLSSGYLRRMADLQNLQ